MTLRRLFVAIVVAGFAALLSAQVTAQSPLSLDECIARAIKRNLDLEIQRFNPQIAQKGIDVARDAYEPELSLTSSHGVARTAAVGTTPGTRSESTDTRLGVTQNFYTGTSVGISTKLDRSELNPAVGTLNPAYNADITISARQQLLRGFGTEINRAVLDRARLGFDKANLDYKVGTLEVIQRTENAYYNLVFAREQLEVRKFSLALAERLHEEAKARRESGVATDLDVFQAGVGVANARRGVILAQQSVRDSEESLLALIGQFELDGTPGTVQFAEFGEALPLLGSSLELARQSQPDYQSARAAIEQLKLDLKIAKDSVKPSLSVGAAVGLNGYRGSGSSAYSDAFNRGNNSWQVDLAFSYPWGQVADKARYHQSLATLSREQTRLRLIEQNIEVQVRAAVRAVGTNFESVKISAQARELSTKQYELEKAKFDAGLSTSRRVLEAQNDLETARVNELQAKVSLRTSLAALHRIEGSSLQRYGVTLP